MDYLPAGLPPRLRLPLHLVDPRLDFAAVPCAGRPCEDRRRKVTSVGDLTRLLAAHVQEPGDVGATQRLRESGDHAGVATRQNVAANPAATRPGPPPPGKEPQVGWWGGHRSEMGETPDLRGCREAVARDKLVNLLDHSRGSAHTGRRPTSAMTSTLSCMRSRTDSNRSSERWLSRPTRPSRSLSPAEIRGPLTCAFSCGAGRARTCDRRIMSPLL